MYLTVKEKLDRVNAAKTEQEQINLLLQYGRQYSQFVDYVRMGFDPTFKFDLPEGRPPFRRNHDVPEQAGSNLIREHRKLQHILPGNGHVSMKREMLFIQMLESISSQEADILLGIHDGGLFDMYPNISLDTIDKAYPNLIVVNSGSEQTKSSSQVVNKAAQRAATPPVIRTREDFDTQITIVDDYQPVVQTAQPTFEQEVGLLTENIKEDPIAPYGYKADGTPKKKPGRVKVQ